jgi:hypothetical protein
VKNKIFDLVLFILAQGGIVLSGAHLVQIVKVKIGWSAGDKFGEGTLQITSNNVIFVS